MLTAFALPAEADDVSDLMDSALKAYEDGDIQYALDELDMARAKLLEMKTASLGSFLPEAPDGWTREINTEMSQGLAMMGGGVGSEATYTDPDGARIKITLMADNPMVMSMSGMIANAAMMGMKTERIQRQKFAIQDRQMMALIANRILVQTDGDPDKTRPLLDKMDFGEMSRFGM
ncbi:hypothetical protein KZZ07_01215 [Mameliella sp. CS4]|nr:hypothetical protein [Mameliella sp. CS4]MBW4981146.1 hypothetical protein [Mameliella sp. CS4]